MLFNSMLYAVFLPVVFILYWLSPSKIRVMLLFLASYYFYMSWNYKYIALIFATTVISYSTGLFLQHFENIRIKKAIVFAAILFCLGILFVFKYFNFVSDTIAFVCARLSLPVHPATLNLVLPVGISFYTFQTIGYIIDIYRGDMKAERNFIAYATFISFFPQLVAGPIEKAENLLPQIKAVKSFDYEKATYGLKLMAWGYFKKLAIADIVSVYVDSAYTSLSNRTSLDSLIAIFFFSFQIYCDFSGYSDIAIGTAKLFNIDLIQNFDCPYLAVNIKDFWHRWHISLSSWFRDYLYIPLGGNRCSKFRKHLNLLITFLVSGLWHGADWKYVIWGGIHGILQVISDCFSQYSRKLYSCTVIAQRVLTFVMVSFVWVFFRAGNLEEAWYQIANVFRAFRDPSSLTYQTLGLTGVNAMRIAIALLILILYDLASLKTDVIQQITAKRTIVRWSVYLILIWLILMLMPNVGHSEFVYFQF